MLTTAAYFISLGTKFQLKLIILVFRNKSVHKGFFQSKTEKMNITTDSAYSNQSRNKFQLKLTIFIFWTTFVQKEYFQLKTVKNEHHQ